MADDIQLSGSKIVRADTGATVIDLADVQESAIGSRLPLASGITVFIPPHWTAVSFGVLLQGDAAWDEVEDETWTRQGYRVYSAGEAAGDYVQAPRVVTTAPVYPLVAEVLSAPFAVVPGTAFYPLLSAEEYDWPDSQIKVSPYSGTAVLLAAFLERTA